MSESFDPYHRWLGIPPKDQPPNHYRLLSLEAFESDPAVIESAADRQMGHLRTYQTGRNAALSQKLLNEVAAAKVCLLNPQKKADYDARLQQQLATKAPPATTEMVSPPVPAVAPPVIDPEVAGVIEQAAYHTTVRQTRLRRKKQANVLVGIFLVGILCSMAVLGVFAWQRMKQGDSTPVRPATRDSGRGEEKGETQSAESSPDKGHSSGSQKSHSDNNSPDKPETTPDAEKASGEVLPSVAKMPASKETSESEDPFWKALTSPDGGSSENRATEGGSMDDGPADEADEDMAAPQDAGPRESDKLSKSNDTIPSSGKKPATKVATRPPGKKPPALSTKWVVRSMATPNGRRYEIDSDKTVHWNNRTATKTRKGDDLLLDFGDGAIERWKFNSQRVAVDRFEPASSYPLGRPQWRGVGEKLRLEKEDALDKVVRALEGHWIIQYGNKTQREYVIDGAGEVLFVNQNRQGKLRLEEGEILLSFGGGPLERLELRGQNLLVEHYSPAGNYPHTIATFGKGTRQR